MDSRKGRVDFALPPEERDVDLRCSTDVFRPDEDLVDDERGRFSEKRVARQAGIWIPDRNLVSVWSLPMSSKQTRHIMNQLIYIIGLIVVVMAVLSLLGLR